MSAPVGLSASAKPGHESKAFTIKAGQPEQSFRSTFDMFHIGASFGMLASQSFDACVSRS